MTIADEIRRVGAEFVAAEVLFSALCEAEQINLFQAASWLMRHMDELNDFPVYAFSHEKQDFYFADEGYAEDLCSMILYPDPKDGPLSWNDQERGVYLLGWLRSDLAAFFSKTGVAMPQIAQAASSLPVAVAVLKPQTSSVDEPHAEVEEVPPSYEQEVLSTKERTTLLCIVGTIAREAKFDISRPSKAATAIVESAASVGIKLGQRTVEEWLKRVPDALERRSN